MGLKGLKKKIKLKKMQASIKHARYLVKKAKENLEKQRKLRKRAERM